MRTRRTLGISTLVAAGACLAAMIGATPAQAVLNHDFSFGGTGTAGGEFAVSTFQGPSGVAVSGFNDHLYVTDPGNNRIQEFEPDGTFVATFGENVNQDTGGNVCTAASGDTCQEGSSGGVGGAFNSPWGIAVDDTTGHVYVLDASNNRVQKFTATGDFLFTWGNNVNADTGGDLCTAASGDTCKPGTPSGDDTTTPITPSANGVFADLSQGDRDNIATDAAGFVYVADPNAVPYARVQKFAPDGSFVSQIAADNRTFNDRGLNFPNSLDVNANGDVYVIDEGLVKEFHASDFTVDGLSASWDADYGATDSVLTGPLSVTIDPANSFVFAGIEVSNDPCPGGGASADYLIYEFHPSGQQIDCTVPTPVIADNNEGGMAVSSDHKLYLADRPEDMIHVYDTPVAELPTIGAQIATEITAQGARINASIAANLGDTTFQVEYGSAPCSANPCASTPESDSIGAAYTPVEINRQLNGLTPASTYFFRVIATNNAGVVAGPDRSFNTFRSPEFDPSCTNNLARQQTGAAFLFDCRAYELVSAENQGGYNVTSDLVPGQTPFGGYPQAPGKALYSVHNGGIPNTGKPTNRGPDPYVATRDAENQRWNTSYVGVPADVGSAAPFSSTVAGADSSLGTFAFGGPDICDPCFSDGSAGIPVRMPNGSGLVQGMQGSLPVAAPEQAGEVKKHLSEDGSHLIFGSMQQFEPAGNSTGTDVTYYSRDLNAGTTQVVSTMPGGATIANGTDVVALDVSEDGSRVVVGNLNSTDAEGNRYWDLYMNTGSPNSVEITSGGSGALYNGMTDDGSQVFFTTRENLDDDTDSSADLFRATVNGAASIERVSTGSGAGDTDACDPAGNSYNFNDWNVLVGEAADCSVVPVGGSGGVASDSGAVYFLSPEQLDGNGVAGAPNLFMTSPGDDPQLVATLESGATTPLPPAEHLFQQSFGSFTRIFGAATDDAGNYYALDAANGLLSPAGTVHKFDASGTPDPGFSISGIVTIGDGSLLGLPVGVPTGIAVDNSPGSPNFGDIYVPSFAGTVGRYDSAGNLEATISGLGAGTTGPVSVAVQPGTGNVYVGVSSVFGAGSTVEVFDPSGAPTAPTSFAVPGIVWGIAVDSAGNTYIGDNGDVTQYDSTGALVGTVDPGPALGVAVDATNDHLYVDRGNEIIEYDSGGSQVGSAIGNGVLTNSIGLGAHAGRVIASNGGSSQISAFSAPVTPPDRAYDSPLVINSLVEAETRHTADFQVTPSGAHSAFGSVRSLTGFDNGTRYEVFRHDAGADQLDCVSCSVTDAIPVTDATLASNGLSLSNEGDVFFTSGEGLVLRDGNGKLDAYQWDEDDGVELISTGQSQFDAGLHSATASGTDVFFFTRERLTNDQNGNLMRLYTARAGGGFFVIPPEPACAASDECHGPGSEPVGRAPIASLAGPGGNPQPQAKQDRCNVRKLARRARVQSRRAKVMRRRVGRAMRSRAGVRDRRAIRRLRIRARRFGRAAKRNRNAATKCRRQTAARRTR